ncbi:zinc-binding protein A33-like isoform X1 [Myxocyprinus asiaticus]|uniref:zinc-binding protein A33-like isoform X1 n=1 Tax=Myxocyprinus asiaticus TaxID=70543 RepID=UPI0022222863|nr:zinc-binding protein A33-like isoform X1 [Myxocyprinus asiaticus]
MSANLPEEDLSCPVCCEIFKHPVLLPCSHSFCRSCLEHFWDSASSRSCPVCRRRASKKSPPSNRALKNLCEAFLLGRGQGNASGSNTLCWRHGEKFKLFCLVDQEPICVVCQASKMHKGHDCSPTEEAALDCKDKLSAAMKVLQHKLEVFSKARQSSAFTLEYIKIQAQRVERQMKEEFLKLHQFLYEEEERRLSSLMEEEAHRVEAMKNRDDDIAWRISSLTDMLSTMEQTINAEDLTLLQNFKATNEGSWSTLQDPECVSGSLLDEPKYLGNLKYKVWQKMQAVAKYNPIILDPNTAHPCLTLSDDLTSLHYSIPNHGRPDNPERFHVSAEVLGSTAFSSASHCWEIEVGENEDWILGLASENVKRDQEVPARPENGFWTICLRDGQYRAMASPPTALKVNEKLQRVKVQLNWDRREVVFSNSACQEILYSFNHAFTEKLLPYFYTQSKHPLRILSKPVLVSIKEEGLCLGK